MCYSWIFTKFSLWMSFCNEENLINFGAFSYGEQCRLLSSLFNFNGCGKFHWCLTVCYVPCWLLCMCVYVCMLVVIYMISWLYWCGCYWHFVVFPNFFLLLYIILFICWCFRMNTVVWHVCGVLCCFCHRKLLPCGVT